MKPKQSQATSLGVLLLCLCLSSWVNAQATNGDAKKENVSPTKLAGNAASANQGAPHDDTYRVGAADVLAVNVWKEPEISRTVTVRSDGKITLPLVGELQAGGLTPLQLEQEITKKLTHYISEPEVAVIVQDSKSQRINILGQVERPGSYLLMNSMTVLDAIAMAGGFKDFAKQKGIYILRNSPDGTQVKFPFNYKDVIKGKNTAQNIRLAPSDTVVVP